MLAIDPKSLKVGQALGQGLYMSSGVKLVGRGVPLTQGMLKTLVDQSKHNEPSGVLYLADSEAEFNGMGPKSPPPKIKLEDPRPRTKLDDPRPASQRETPDPDSLESRRLRATKMKSADAYVAELEISWEKLPLKLEKSEVPLDLSARHRPGWPSEAKLNDFRRDRVEIIRRLYDSCMSGVRVDGADPGRLVDELIALLTEYPERFAQVALIENSEQEYLPGHAFSTCVLSIAIAARMGWSQEAVRWAGLSGMLLDLGMATIPVSALEVGRTLSDVEVNRVFRHPAQSVVLAECVSGLHEQVRRAIYQHHERENGAGYPRQLKARKIADLAKCVAVADAYAAATEGRAFRRALLPYNALEELISLGSQRMFDRTMIRSLVQCTGLFPVGSFVRLSSGEIGRVVGVHPDRVDRPQVCVYRMAQDGFEPGSTVDLSEYEPWALHVIQATEPPEMSAIWEMRERARAPMRSAG